MNRSGNLSESPRARPPERATRASYRVGVWSALQLLQLLIGLVLNVLITPALDSRL
jgi:hypothetical protein